MVRPNCAYGRPNTRVIPDAWAISHAPVTDAACTDEVRVVLPGTDPVWDPVSRTSSVPDVPVWSGMAEVLDAAAGRALAGGEDLATNQYLIRLPHDAALTIPADRAVDDLVVHFDASADPLLTGRRLSVDGIERGTRGWSRFITATLAD